MPPVQTFSSSPITAAKAPSATGQAQQSPGAIQTPQPFPPTTTANNSTSASASRYAPPAAQPASRPSVPTATPAAVPVGRGLQPTRTTTTQSVERQSSSPPPPQPGALPTPPGTSTAATATATSRLPPPPKAGDTIRSQHGTGVEVTTNGQKNPNSISAPTTMPAQMSWQPPTASHSVRGTSSAIDAGGNPISPYAAPLSAAAAAAPPLPDMSHPPGYQQNALAAEFSTGQRAAHEAYVAQNSDLASAFGGDGHGNGTGEAIWNTAKKWASAAGDSLAAAENEVWKAVNQETK